LWGIYNAIITVIAFAIGIPWGASGVATAYAISVYVLLYPSLWYPCLDTPINPGDFFRPTLKPACASILMCLAGIYLAQKMQGIHDLITLSVGMFTCAGSYLLCWVLMPNGRADLREFARYINMAISKKERSGVTKNTLDLTGNS